MLDVLWDGEEGGAHCGNVESTKLSAVIADGYVDGAYPVDWERGKVVGKCDERASGWIESFEGGESFSGRVDVVTASTVRNHDVR